MEDQEDILPSVKYDVPKKNDNHFRVDFPVYLEPGLHLVEITRTTSITILHFNVTNTTLTIPDFQKQQFYVNYVSEIRGVVLTKNSSAYVATGTKVTFVLSINEGSNMNIYISEDYSLFNGGATTNKVFDLKTGNSLL